MKKIIVTLCSLALSLAGTFGVNELSNQKDNTIDATSNINNEVQYVENMNEQTSLPVDNNAEVEEVQNETAEAKKEEVAPAEKKAPAIANKKTEDSTKVANNTATEEKKASTVKSSKETRVKETLNQSKKTVTNNTAPTKQIAVTNNAEKQNITNNAPKTTTVVNNANNSSNGKVFVYKNVDLSDCNNTNEVVDKLQKYGFDNINMGNVNDISSLEDILGMINGSSNNGSTGNTGTTTPAPTKKPTPTTTPAPTKKPTPTTAPTPTTKPEAPTNNSGISNYANQVLQLVNQERAKAGLSALTTNSTLTAAADKRAQETVQSFSHTRPNGTSFSTVLKEYGISYRTSGENIAYGQRSPQEVVNGWMNSPGHRANILNANFNKIGIGVYQQNGVIYWSQLFTN